MQESQHWINLDNTEITNYLKEHWNLKNKAVSSNIRLIGKFTKTPRLNWITDLRDLDFGRIAYPDSKYQKEIKILLPLELELKENNYYEFTTYILPVEKRVRKENLKIFGIVTKSLKEITPKDFIQKRNNLYEGLNNEFARSFKNSVKILTSDINRQQETFVYELIQNADDYKDPNKSNVEAKFFITDKYLLLSHSGQSFDYQNVYALTGISQGDKRENIETIGFKGIGFKSLFKISDYVSVRSGEFSFRFDKEYYEKTQMPWQVIPIWHKETDSELTNIDDYSTANVSIAIRMGKGQQELTEQRETFKKILLDVFNDDRILIFLRNVSKVEIIDQIANTKLISINKTAKKWITSRDAFKMDVPLVIREWLNEQIEDEEISIPEKYQNIQSTKITFAAERNDNHIIGTENSKFYNYLPTEIDFGFNFLVNGDFIPDGSRTEIHDNIWNKYLIEVAGESFVKWLSMIGAEKLGTSFRFVKDYIKLIPDFNNPKAAGQTKNLFFLEGFKSGFAKALTAVVPVQFIPLRTGALGSLNEVLIDDTGLFSSNPSLLHTLGIQENLIDKAVGEEGISRIRDLIKEFKVGKILTKKDLQLALPLPDVINWLKIPANNLRVFKFLLTEPKLRDLLDTEKLILTDSYELLSLPETYLNVPNEIKFLTKNILNNYVRASLNNSPAKIPFRPFDSGDFLVEHAEVIKAIDQRDQCISIWNFIYNQWEVVKVNENLKQNLKLFKVPCKLEVELKMVSTVYLPKELVADSADVESIINELKLSEKYFINVDPFGKDQRWKEIFKVAKAKYGSKDIVFDIIDNLEKINDGLQQIALKHVFHYWKENRLNNNTMLTTEQLSTIQKNAKITCDSGLLPPSQAMIPPHYSTDENLDQILPQIKIKQLITKNYDPGRKNITDWLQFFKEIGCIILTERQIVYNFKINDFLVNQINNRSNHFELIKELQDLIQKNSQNETNPILINLEQLSTIELMSSVEGNWLKGADLFLGSIYQPNLDLQADKEISENCLFLSQQYHAKGITKEFLINWLLVAEDFNFIRKEEKYTINLSSLILIPKYNDLFWNFLCTKAEKLEEFRKSDTLEWVRTNKCLSTLAGLEFPSKLHSTKLTQYIEDKSILPTVDLSKIFIDTESKISLEELIGVNQDLSMSHCLDLLRRSAPPTIAELKSIGLVNILEKCIFNERDLNEIKLPNQEGNYFPIAELYYSEDEEMVFQNREKLMNPAFSSLIKPMGIHTVEKSNLKLVYEKTENSTVGKNIKFALLQRAEFIAFIMVNEDGDKEKYQILAKKIQDEIEPLIFQECDVLGHEYQYLDLKWMFDARIVMLENNIFFTDSKTIEKYLHSNISKYGNINRRKLIKYLNSNNVKDIVVDLMDNFEDIPEKWSDMLKRPKQLSFEEEVLEFIKNELENTEWSKYIPELKSVLELAVSQSKEKQKLFNLIAKIKLTKHIGLSFEQSENNFNQISINGDKYFVHSARGSFAYIHPNEILKMKNENYKMALDFSTNSQIKIYDTAEDILLLNRNHLLLYQYEKTIDELLHFCQTNTGPDRHLLIVDRQMSMTSASDIISLLNKQDDYR